MLIAGLRTIQYILVVKDAVDTSIQQLIRYALCTMVAMAAIPVCAQQGVDLQQQVKLPASPMRLDSLLSIVSRQGKVKFSLNTRKFPPSTIIPVRKGVRDIAGVLADIRKRTGIYYTILGTHIIFIDNPPVARGGRKPVPTGDEQGSAVQPQKAVLHREKVLHQKPAIQQIAALPQNVPQYLYPIKSIYIPADCVRYVINRMNDTLRKQPPQQVDSVRLKENYVRSFIFPGIYERPPDSVWYGVPGRERGYGYRQAPRLRGDESFAMTRAPRLRRDKKEWRLFGRKEDTTVVIRQAGLSAADTTTKPSLSSPTSSETSKTLSGSNTPERHPRERRARTYRYRNVGGPKEPLSFFVSPGMVVGETFYANPTVQLGVPFLYGIVSYSTDFRIGALRYGAGTSIRLNDDWRMLLTATTGSMQSASTDTGSARLKVKARLHMITLAAGKDLGGGLRLQAGISVNMLKNEFFQDDVPSPLNMSETEAHRRLKMIRPPYTLSNNYSPDAAVSNKLWIGIQAGIFYYLPFHKRR